MTVKMTHRLDSPYAVSITKKKQFIQTYEFDFCNIFFYHDPTVQGGAPAFFLPYSPRCPFLLTSNAPPGCFCGLSRVIMLPLFRPITS